jgi:hypothetical protein
MPDIVMPAGIPLVPLDALRPHPRNARTHSDGQVAKLAGLIRAFGWTQPILVAGETIIAGHGRVAAARLLGLDAVPAIRIDHLAPAQQRALVIADNRVAEEAGWDRSLLAAEIADLDEAGIDLALTAFDPASIDDLLADAQAAIGDAAGDGDEADDDDAGDAAEPTGAGSLAARFGVAPFSVLNAREGWWQDRKRAWIALGLRSEVGRGLNLLAFSDTVRAAVSPKPDADAPATLNLAAPGGASMSAKSAWKRADGAGGYVNPPGSVQANLTFVRGDRDEASLDPVSRQILAAGSGTSIFDPVLCELAYRWFCPPGGLVLDPFAGGSVRGVVASRLGRRYIGVELRGEQVAANREQIGLCREPVPTWIEGDSRDIRTLAGGAEADFVFSCPPYADLERYSDDPRDLSNLGYAAFRDALADIVGATCEMLKPDRFACFVVGDVRAPGGAYRGLPWHTIEAFEAAGMALHNEAILVTAVGSLPVRAGRAFEASRKLGKTHQQVLVFCKGDPAKATAAVGRCEFGAIEDDAAAETEAA